MTDAPIKGKILEDLKIAMRNQEKERVNTLRLILAGLKQREVDERITLSDADIIALLDKMLKQRRESIVQFEAGQRGDLVKKEQEEIRIIQEYLPSQLSDQEITAMIEEAIRQTGATSVRDMGKVMGLLKPKMQGRTDLGQVSAKIKERLPA